MVAALGDERVLAVKVADRLHSMRAPRYMDRWREEWR